MHARSYEEERQSLDSGFLAKASCSASAAVARPEAATRRSAGRASRACGEAALDVLEIGAAWFLVGSQSSVDTVASRSAENCLDCHSGLRLLGMASTGFHWQQLPAEHSYWFTQTGDSCLMTDWPLQVCRTYTHI